jgi:predicted RNA-binding Zn ribbon-like protein
MSCQGENRSVAKQWTFHLSGGPVALDFANTVSWRRSDRPIERLREYGDLVEWARQSGILTTPAAQALVRSARRRPAMATRVLARTRALREVVYRLLAGLGAGRSPALADLGLLDREFHDALRHLHLTPTPAGVRLGWARDTEPPLALPLWAAVRSAADVLVAATHRRLKTCPASNCGWLFLDTSRSGTRRWCDMKVCGSRAKARAYYARHRSSRKPRRSSLAPNLRRRRDA